MNAPLAEAVQDNAEVPEPVTLVGLRVHASPVEGDTADESATTPAKPLTAVTVIVEVAVPATLIAAEVGLVLIVKSCTTKVTEAVWDSDPLVPVTVTVKVVVVVEEHERVEV